MTEETRRLIADIAKRFESILEDGQQCDIQALIAEVPTDSQDEALKCLIPMEIDFYRERNWTYSKLAQRQQQFPQLEKFILRTVSGSKRDLVEDSVDPESPRQLRYADCSYSTEPLLFDEGGQGALYKATDLVLGNREVAIKVVKDPADAKKFRQEAEVTAKLDHPGIAAVYSYSESGRHENDQCETVDGRPFYAMRLINGKPLAELISEYHNSRLDGTNRTRKLRLNQDSSFVSLIEMLISACQTISYGHSVGVLHCDIKPQNIMCGEFGATVVLDWGSAVSAPETDRPTRRTGKRINCPEWTNDSQYTEAYASPEQIGGRLTSGKFATQTMQLTEASDVFSLGATLYQIITGRAPIDLPDYHERLNRDQIGSVRQTSSNCSRRLESICIKAMRKNPADRYATSEELAHDLSCWLRGDKISAHSDSIFDSIFRFANRHRMVTGLSFLALSMILLGVNRYNAHRFKEAKLKANRDSGFTLIENICEPLENGELQNPKELESVAELVRDHTQRHIEKESASLNDNLMLARIYNLSSLTGYYYVNYGTTSESEISGGGNSPTSIDDAIGDIDTAIRLFTKQKDEEFVSERLARSWLFKARLHFRREAMKQADDAEEDLELDFALKAIANAQSLFSKESGKRLNESQIFKRAETYQLLGEIQLRKLSKLAGESDFAAYQKSASAFETCNDILEEFQPVDTSEKQKRTRALGRGYGYLGDVYRDQSRYKEAFTSYRESLNYREAVLKEDRSPENMRQLARGHTNFIRTLRNFGVYPPLADDNGNEPVTLQDLSDEARQKLIGDIVEKYIGVNGGLEEGSGTESGFQLFAQLERMGAKTSRIEYADILNVVAELYFQAAKQTDPVSADLLIPAVQRATEAQRILEPYYDKDSNDKETRTRLARSLMIQLQIQKLRENGQEAENAGFLTAKILDLLPKLDDGTATGEDLFMRCVAFACDRDTFASKFEKGLEILAQSGLRMDWRIQQHFDDTAFKSYIEQKNDFKKKNGLNPN